MSQPPSITVILQMGIVTLIYEIYQAPKPRGSTVHALPLEARVLKNRVTKVSSCSSISWHIEDMHERFSMCNTNPENDLKSIRHPGQVNGRVMLSSGFKGSLDSSSFTSFSFELLLLGVKSVATE